jgi:hypothetical protein
VFSQVSATWLIQVACSVTPHSQNKKPYKSYKYKKITVLIAVCPANEKPITYATLGKGLHAESINREGVEIPRHKRASQSVVLDTSAQKRKNPEPVGVFLAALHSGY